MSRKHVVSRRSFLKGLASIAGGLAVQTSLASCRPATTAPEAPAEEATPTTKPAAPSKEKVELSHMTWWLPPLVIGTAVEHAVEQFNENNPDIHVTIAPNPGGATAQLQKWQTMLAAGNPPDMTLMRPHYHTAFASRGALLQIDDLLDAEPDFAPEDFWPQTIKRLSWEGKLWGLAAEIWFSFIFMNKDMLGKADLEMPSWDWTWDDYLEYAVKMTQGEGIEKEFGSALMTWMWTVMVWSWGGEVLDAEEKTCMVNKAPAPEAIQWLADLRLVHEAAPSAEELADQNETALFETGRVGMFPRANWYLIEALTKFEGEWDVAPDPIGPGGRSALVQGANYAVFKLTKHPDEAWRLLFDMSAGEGQKLILRETAIFPSVQRYATLDFMPQYKQEWIDVSLESAKVARAQHLVPKFVEWNNAANKELGEVWVGRKTAQEAADAMCPEINKILGEE